MREWIQVTSSYGSNKYKVYKKFKIRHTFSAITTKNIVGKCSLMQNIECENGCISTFIALLENQLPSESVRIHLFNESQCIAFVQTRIQSNSLWMFMWQSLAFFSMIVQFQMFAAADV